MGRRALLLVLVASLVASAAAASYSANVLGRTYNDPQVTGFNGEKFTYETFGITRTMPILSRVNKWWLRGQLTTDAAKTSAYVRSVEFQTATVRGGDIIRVTASKQSFIVTLNGKPFTPSQRRIIGGTLTYLQPTLGQSRVVQVARSGVDIRVVQQYDALAVKYRPWLDVHVSLTDPAPRPGYRGVLARSLPV